MAFRRAIGVFLILSCGAAFALQEPQRPRSIGVDVDLVLINVTVVDHRNRYVAGLKKENFQIWEDRVEQEIAYLFTEDAPMSLGIVLDTSGSMKSTIGLASRSAGSCIDVGNQDDEYFLVVFSNRPRLLSDFTTEIGTLQSRLLFLEAKGSTALYDAVYLGLNKLKEGGNPRKALLVITDGYDNNSRYNPSTIREFVREEDIQIFTIGNEGDGMLHELVELTGGREFRPRGVDGLTGICNQIVQELKQQYVIGYRSTNETKDGKWRDVRVRLNVPPGMSKPQVRARSGYYAPDGARRQ